LGTLLFALAHLMVAWFNGVDFHEQTALLATGALFGVGLNLALYALPAKDDSKRMGALVKDWFRERRQASQAAARTLRNRAGALILDGVWRIAVAALVAVSAQLLAFAVDPAGPAATITRIGSHYRLYFGKLPNLHGLVTERPVLTAMFDVVSVAVLLVFGIAWGLRVAIDRYERREELERLAVE
jgi:hypothetical protein